MQTLNDNAYVQLVDLNCDQFIQLLEHCKMSPAIIDVIKGQVVTGTLEQLN